MIYQPIPYKRCTTCKQWKPMTTEWFSKCKACVCGLRYNCKECGRKYSSAYYGECDMQHRREVAQAWRENNRERHREINNAWRARDKEHARAVDKAYREKNKKRISNYRRIYRTKKRDRMLDRERKWRLNHPGATQIINNRREARKRKLPDGFSIREWRRALKYFGGCCAVCGRPPGLFHILAADHWIALSDPRADNPGTTAINIVPLCHAKTYGDGCNNNKSNRDAHEWLVTEFGKRKAAQIEAKIEAYFEWVRRQQD